MRILLFFPVLCAMVLWIPSVYAQSEKIAAVVNDGAISMSDLNDRLNLIATSSGLPKTPEIYEKLTGQVMGLLVDEELMMQEARRLEIKVSQEEIDQGFATVAKQNNFSAEEFRGMLQRSGINITTMQRQIEAQIAWTKIVQAKVRPRISISDSDIDTVMNRLISNKGMSEYHVAEIFLPVDSPESEGDVSQLSQKLSQQIQKDQSSFFKLAQQFSKSAGASQGGDIGWVQEDQLPEELSGVLKTMQKGKVSAPIRSLSGYHIIFLLDVRLISDETMPPRDEIYDSLGTQRLDRMQRRYLQDLRAAAFIESRV